MPSFRRRLIELAFFLSALTLFCGLSVHAVEGCDHHYVMIEEYPSTCQTPGTVTYRCTECSDVRMDITDPLLHTWKTVSQTVPTCDRPGSITKRCTECSAEVTEINGDATGHSYPEDHIKAPTCTEQGYTYHVCEDCGNTEILEDSYTAELPHSYGEGNILTEPTCQQLGYIEYTCTVCSHNYRESVEKVGHSLSEELHAPTHTEKGYTIFCCSYCGLTWLDNFTEKRPYDMEYTEIAPTCTQNGSRLGVCRDGCSHTEQETLPATGHHFGDDENEGWTLTREPSEALDGLEQRICADCGLTQSRTVPYTAPTVEAPERESNPLLLIGIAGSGVILLGILLLALMIMLERASDKNTRKYAVLSAVDKALAGQEQQP